MDLGVFDVHTLDDTLPLGPSSTNKFQVSPSLLNSTFSSTPPSDRTVGPNDIYKHLLDSGWAIVFNETLLCDLYISLASHHRYVTQYKDNFNWTLIAYSD